MARRVFFSFHYERDIWRANEVRNSWIGRDREDSGFFDASLWEDAKRKGDAAIKKLIDAGLQNTSVTAILIGAETAKRKYVEYEITESYARGNGLLAVHIHRLKNSQRLTDVKGENPLANLYVERDGKRYYLTDLYETYDYVTDQGYSNFRSWVEKAAKAAGK